MRAAFGHHVPAGDNNRHLHGDRCIGHTATCSFTVTAFNVCLQDDTNPNSRLLINTFTGEYRFFCANTPTPFAGIGRGGGEPTGVMLVRADAQHGSLASEGQLEHEHEEW